MSFISVQESKEWESGLFDIFADGCGTCCLSACLPCYQYGKNRENHSRQTGNKKSVCCEHAVKYCLVFGACLCVSYCGSAVALGTAVDSLKGGASAVDMAGMGTMIFYGQLISCLGVDALFAYFY